MNAATFTSLWCAALAALTAAAVSRALRRGPAAAAVQALVAAGAPSASPDARTGARSPSSGAALWVGVGALVFMVASVVGPGFAVAGVALVVVARVRAGRRARARRAQLIDTAMPDLIDLFVIAASAGHPVTTCLRMVTPRAPRAAAEGMHEAVSALDRGVALHEALQRLGQELGTLGPPLSAVLTASAATGAPLGPSLKDVAAVARDRRRREAENQARRLPVTLLFPLICCVLPAFILLAVVPLLAASVASLEI